MTVLFPNFQTYYECNIFKHYFNKMSVDTLKMICDIKKSVCVKGLVSLPTHQVSQPTDSHF